MCKKMIQLSPEGEKLNKILMILFFIDVGFIILRVIFERYDILFSSIIAAVLLLCSFIMCYYLLLMFLLFFLSFDLFFSLVFLFLRIQNACTGDYDKYLNEVFYQAGLGIECCAFAFKVVLLYFIFKAYKEFKAICLGYSESYQPLNQNDTERNAPGYGSFGMNNANSNSNENNGRQEPPVTEPSGYKAFSGEGVQLGGS